MLMIIFLVFIAIVYFCLPWYIELACFIINLFIPDTTPFIDEFLMFVPIISKIKKIILLSEILRKYGKIILALILALIAGIIAYSIYF